MRVILFAFLLLLPFGAFCDVISQSPQEEWLKNYASKSISQLKDIEKKGDVKATYAIGVLYLDGSPRQKLEQNYKKAAYYLKKAWDAGIADAGYILAAMHYNGQGVEKNNNKALELLASSAELGLLSSQAVLGRAYWGQKYENLVPKNMNKSIYWLKKASSSGDASSAFGLAYIYENGIGVKENYAKAFEWRKKSINAKYNMSQGYFLPLARYYEKGIGTEKNFVQAYKCYDLSGTAGAEGKQRVAKRMTREQIDEARRQSQAWQEEHNIRIGSGFIRRVE